MVTEEEEEDGQEGFVSFWFGVESDLDCLDEDLQIRFDHLGIQDSLSRSTESSNPSSSTLSPIHLVLPLAEQSKSEGLLGLER